MGWEAEHVESTCPQPVCRPERNQQTLTKHHVRQLWCHKAKKKKIYVALTRPKFENWVGRSIFFFFFFLRTVRELSFPIFFLKFLNGENSGGMQSKRIYKCFFKPLNTNLSKFFAKIWHFQQQKNKQKKPDPVFSHFTVGRERAT